MRATLIIRVGLLAAASLLLTLAACTSGGGADFQPTSASTATASAAATGAATTAVSQKALPLGDGHIGTSARVGYVDACQTAFPPGGGGAFRDGPWIHGATWDATAKLAVQGSVSWPQARYGVTISGDRRIITTNDLPERFTTGVFPIAATDPAFAYDRNPNAIGAQTISYSVPAHPAVAASPTCVNMGPIGVLSDGVVLFNALDAEGRDAVAHEVLDHCGGHPERSGAYHHHDIPPCLLATATGSSTLVGYARDGFGIYVERDAQGDLPTDADLDACHGRTGPIMWDGGQVTMYHYVATAEYPFTLGCYRGTPGV